MAWIDASPMNLRCPVCGCTSLEFCGNIDTTNQQFDDNAEVTCMNCGEENSADYFVKRDDHISSEHVLDHNGVPQPNFTSIEQFIEQALDTMCADLYESRLEDYDSKEHADGIAAAYRRVVEHQLAKLTKKLEVETAIGTLTATPTDAITIQRGIDIQLNGEAVCTIAEKVDADNLTIDMTRLDVYGWNDAHADSIDWEHAFKMLN